MNKYKKTIINSIQQRKRKTKEKQKLVYCTGIPQQKNKQKITKLHLTINYCCIMLRKYT